MTLNAKTRNVLHYIGGFFIGFEFARLGNMGLGGCLIIGTVSAAFFGGVFETLQEQINNIYNRKHNTGEYQKADWFDALRVAAGGLLAGFAATYANYDILHYISLSACVIAVIWTVRQIVIGGKL